MLREQRNSTLISSIKVDLFRNNFISPKHYPLQKSLEFHQNVIQSNTHIPFTMHYSTIVALFFSATAVYGSVLRRGGDDNGGDDNNGGNGNKYGLCKQDDCYGSLKSHDDKSFCSKYMTTKSCPVPQYMTTYNSDSISSACSCYIKPSKSSSSTPAKTTSVT